MGNIFRKIKNFYNADKLYLVFSLLKEKNGNHVPEMLRIFSQKRMLRNGSYLRIPISLCWI